MPGVEAEMIQTSGAPFERKSTLGGALGRCALLGAASGLGLVAAQLACAWSADLLWTVERPLLSAAALLLLAAAAALCVGGGLHVLCRALAPRLQSGVVVAAAAALTLYGARSGLSAFLRGRQGLPGGGSTALLAQAGVWLLLVLLAATVLRRRAVGVPRRMALLALATLAPLAASLTHAIFLADKDLARAGGWLGPWALLLTGGAGLLALVLAAMFSSRALPARWLAALLVLALGFESLRVLRVDELRALLPADAGTPHVVLVVLDTLRRDAVSGYGVVSGSTPHLDALAARGVRFADCISPAPWTVPAHASLFTGAEVSRHGADHRRERLRATPGGPGTEPLMTLATLLAARGLPGTALVSNMNVSRARGFDAGFERFHELWRAGQGDFDLLATLLSALQGALPGALQSAAPADKGGALAVRGAKAWAAARAQQGTPGFLFVNLMESHAPYDHVPAPYAGAFLEPGDPSASVAALLDRPLAFVHRAGVDADDAAGLWRAYLGAVQYQDALLGQLLAALDEHGLSGNTLLVVTSDHGENFGWQGLLGHGQDLNDDLLRVPLVMAGPELPVGVVDASPASLVDVLPTLLSLIHAPALPADAGRTGWPLLGPLARARPAPARRLRVAEKLPAFLHKVSEYEQLIADQTGEPGDPIWGYGRAALMDGPLKLVTVDGPVADELRLRLSERVGEPRPPLGGDGRRSVDDDVLVAALADRLALLLGAWAPAVPSDEPDETLDEEQRAALRALGYVAPASDGAAPAGGDGGR